MTIYLTLVVCLLSCTLCLGWVAALHQRNAFLSYPEHPSRGVARGVQGAAREMFLLLSCLFVPLFFSLLSPGKGAELSLVPIAVFFSLLGCGGLMWMHYIHIRDGGSEYGAAGLVRYTVLGAVLAFYPFCLFLETKGSMPGTLAVAVSMTLLGQLVGISAWMVLLGLSLASSLLTAHFLHPEELSTVLKDKELHLAFSQIFLGSMVAVLLHHKTERKHEETLVLEKLELFARKTMQTLSEVLGVLHSHANVIELCCKSMQPVTSAGEAASDQPEGEAGLQQKILAVDPDVYEVLLDRLEQFHAANRSSSEMLHHLLRPIRTKVPRTPFSQYHISNCVYEALRLCCGEKRLENKLDLDLGEDFLFWGCREQLVTALIQLLDNALRYTPQEGKVSLWAKDHRLYVKNSGVSLSGEQLNKLFLPFVSNKKSSLGLGLYYVQKVMEAFGGRVEHVCSPGEQATCFMLCFPQGQQAAVGGQV